MKKEFIKTGRTYSDGKGSFRKVIAEGPQYTLYDGQECRDNLRYVLVAKKRGPHVVGSEHNSTRASFAAWAKAEVPEGKSHDDGR